MSAELYERVWARPEYREMAPGEHLVDEFIRVANPDARVIDFGSGTGRGAAKLHRKAKVPVLALDFAANSMDPQVKGVDGIEFRQHDLRNPVGESAPYGFCTDVLEHIAPEEVDSVLRNIFDAAGSVFLAISTRPDIRGEELVGEPLHLTVESPYWWHDKLESLGINIGWSRYVHEGEFVCFYAGRQNVSVFASAGEVRSEGTLNIEEQKVVENIRANLALGLKEVAPYLTQPDQVVYVLAGGPSLSEFEQEILEGARSGIPCVTVNGTYKWLYERGVKSAAQVVTDGRAFNARFVDPVLDSCKYLISSQCDPSVFEKIPKEQSMIWHAAGDLVNDTVRKWLDEQGIAREWFPIHGGTTVTVCTLVILAMLGYRKIEVFGWDSCFVGKDHHAYSQPENDADQAAEVLVGDRVFRCAPWMLLQADDALRVIKYIFGRLDDFEMVVHGDGLIATLLKDAAKPQEH